MSAQSCENAQKNIIHVDNFLFKQQEKNRYYLNTLINVTEMIDTDIMVFTDFLVFFLGFFLIFVLVFGPLHFLIV